MGYGWPEMYGIIYMAMGYGWAEMYGIIYIYGYGLSLTRNVWYYMYMAMGYGRP